MKINHPSVPCISAKIYSFHKHRNASHKMVIFHKKSRIFHKNEGPSTNINPPWYVDCGILWTRKRNHFHCGRWSLARGIFSCVIQAAGKSVDAKGDSSPMSGQNPGYCFVVQCANTMINLYVIWWFIAPIDGDFMVILWWFQRNAFCNCGLNSEMPSNRSPRCAPPCGHLDLWSTWSCPPAVSRCRSSLTRV